MADIQFPTEQIYALVIQKNNEQFIDGYNVTGRKLLVPVKNVIVDEDSYWMVPIKDEGRFTRLVPVLSVTDGGVAVSQPTYDSFKVIRVRDKLTNNTWWIYGSVAEFFTSASVTGSTPTAMPGIDGAWNQRISPCDQPLCQKDANGNYFIYTALPTLSAGYKYFGFGSYNNAPLFRSAATGYSSIAALLSFMNTNWTPFVWTNPSGNIIKATGGALNDLLCVTIIALLPSS